MLELESTSWLTTSASRQSVKHTNVRVYVWTERESCRVQGWKCWPNQYQGASGYSDDGGEFSSGIGGWQGRPRLATLCTLSGVQTSRPDDRSQLVLQRDGNDGSLATMGFDKSWKVSSVRDQFRVKSVCFIMRYQALSLFCWILSQVFFCYSRLYNVIFFVLFQHVQDQFVFKFGHSIRIPSTWKTVFKYYLSHLFFFLFLFSQQMYNMESALHSRNITILKFWCKEFFEVQMRNALSKIKT